MSFLERKYFSVNCWTKLLAMLLINSVLQSIFFFCSNNKNNNNKCIVHHGGTWLKTIAHYEFWIHYFNQNLQIRSSMKIEKMYFYLATPNFIWMMMQYKLQNFNNKKLQKNGKIFMPFWKLIRVLCDNSDDDDDNKSSTNIMFI